MATYHLNHKSIGRTTHAAGTAAAHIGYITRSSACDKVIGLHMPLPKANTRGGITQRWLNHQEENDRKNARVIDKMTLALPHALEPDQQEQLVQDFVRSFTDDRAPWIAAFHRRGKDKNNQHCHIAVRDRDTETGKRVYGRSGKGLTQELREKWTAACNAALEAAGHDERIDHRSLFAQGIKREPQRHEGPVPRQIQLREGKSIKIDRIKIGMKPRRKAMAAARTARQRAEIAQQVPFDPIETYIAFTAPLRRYQEHENFISAYAIAFFAHDPEVDITPIIKDHIPEIQNPTDLREVRERLLGKGMLSFNITNVITDHSELEQPYERLSRLMSRLPSYEEGKRWARFRRSLTEYFDTRSVQTIINAVEVLAGLVRDEKIAALTRPDPPLTTSSTTFEQPAPQAPRPSAPSSDMSGP